MVKDSHAAFEKSGGNFQRPKMNEVMVWVVEQRVCLCVGMSGVNYSVFIFLLSEAVEASERRRLCGSQR